MSETIWSLLSTTSKIVCWYEKAWTPRLILNKDVSKSEGRSDVEATSSLYSFVFVVRIFDFEYWIYERVQLNSFTLFSHKIEEREGYELNSNIYIYVNTFKIDFSFCFFFLTINLSQTQNRLKFVDWNFLHKITFDTENCYYQMKSK